MEEKLKKINDEFCEVAGIKRACCCIRNLDTGEVRYYSNISSLYKKPVGWENYDGFKISDVPVYPDLIGNDANFLKLLNVQWDMFKSLGQCYKNYENEPFQATYLKTRLNGIKTCKSFGGGEMLDEYLKSVRNVDFEYMELPNVIFEYDQASNI